MLISMEDIALTVDTEIGKKESNIRRIVDIIISSLVLIITFPILLIAAIAIKIESPGPALFIHERTGQDGKKFKMVKFRGMVSNALEIGPVLTQENDPRLTRVGKFLRRTSIDELPNFFNVLTGSMTIIGPRPEMPTITENYTNQQREIFSFKPGVTGYSQVNGRQRITPEQRVQMEIDYYKNSNAWTDLKIFFKTFKVVINNDGNI
jgi:undecaprenyl phosphate N,N'-diacetylbacillosamine 1-phosphate transferase